MSNFGQQQFGGSNQRTNTGDTNATPSGHMMHNNYQSKESFQTKEDAFRKGNQQWKTQQRPGQDGAYNALKESIQAPKLTNMQQNQRSKGFGDGGKSKGNQELKVVSLMITQIESPCLFWGQVVDDETAEKLLKVTNDLATVCPTSPPVPRPEFRKVYGTRYSEDQMWYRCRLIKPVKNNKCKVLFIDYGNSEEKDVSELVELPHSISSTGQFAQYFCFFGIKPAFEDPETSGYVQGKEFLEKLTMEKSLTCKVFQKHEKLPFTPVILEDDTQQDEAKKDINQMMLNAGFGTRRFKGAGDQNTTDRNDFSQNNRHDRSGGGVGSSGFSAADAKVSQPIPGLMQIDTRNNESLDKVTRGHQNTQQPPFQGHQNTQQPQFPAPQFPPPQQKTQQPQFPAQQFPPPQQKTQPPQFSAPQFPPPQQKTQQPQFPAPQQKRPPVNSMNSGTGSTFMSSDALEKDLARLKIREQQLENDNLNLRINLESREKKERAAQTSIEKAKEDLDMEREQISLELSDAKTQIMKLQDGMATLQKMNRESNLNHRLVHLQNGVQRVRKLRLQFPTDSEVQDNIQRCIDALMEGDQRIETDLGATAKVKGAVKLYNAAQEEIRQCADKSSLPSLITLRDDLRKDLYKSIEEFGKDVANLPLTERGNQLEQCIMGLEDTHFVFLKKDKTENLDLEEAVDRYKNWKERLKFDVVRTKTNTDHNALNSALGLLRKQLSMDINEPQNHASTSGDLNNLLSRFMEDLNSEISETDIEKTEDAPFISTLVCTLIDALKEEMVNIGSLHKLVVEYDQQKTQLESWLEAKPDISELKSLLSKIKQLKSQLRHRLADKLDLEEGDESGGEEMDRVKEALCDIRHELHTAFIVEEESTLRLAELTQDFPELLLQNPELGLDTVLAYNGLVKTGRSLDQYYTEDSDRVSSNVIVTKFADRDVVLKEYFIEASLGITKEDFLDRALAYRSVCSPYLMPVETIFFIKDNKKAYVQLPKYLCLSEVTGDVIQGWSEQIKQSIVKGVVEGLKALHDNSLIHGGVHPNNVFIQESGTGKTILSEYSFSGPSKQHFKSSSGLKFVAPDSRLSSAADMYCVGLLVLYLNNPLITNATDPHTSLHPLLQGIVKNLVLQEGASVRYTAEELLSESYFDDSSLTQEETTLQLTPKSSATRDASGKGILKAGSAYSDTGDDDNTCVKKEVTENGVMEDQLLEDTCVKKEVTEDGVMEDQLLEALSVEKGEVNEDSAMEEELFEEAAKAELPEETGDLYNDEQHSTDDSPTPDES